MKQSKYQEDTLQHLRLNLTPVCTQLDTAMNFFLKKHFGKHLIVCAHAAPVPPWMYTRHTYISESEIHISKPEMFV